MTKLIVYGIPDSTEKDYLKDFWKSLRCTAASLKKRYRATEDEFVIFFPRDLMQEGLGEEIIVTVITTYAWSYDARHEFITEIIKVIKAFFPEAENDVVFLKHISLSEE